MLNELAIVMCENGSPHPHIVQFYGALFKEVRRRCLVVLVARDRRLSSGRLLDLYGIDG